MRIVDLSRVLAGPYATMVLADLGAEVIKIERPEGGDETRSWGPPFTGGESAYFLSVNRSKRSCAIDMAKAEGREIVLELCAGADAVIENFKAGGAERLGVGEAQVRERNQSVVYCSITGFGSDREPPGRTGYDFVVQAESGLMSITGPVDGEPHKVGVALVDVLTGLHAATAVAAALRTGEGAHIEVPLIDSALASLVNVAQGTLVTGSEAKRHGNAHPSIVPYQDYPTAAGRIAIAAPNDGLFARLCTAIGRAKLADDKRFVTNADRVVNREALEPLLGEAFAVKPAEEWVALLGSAGVPAGEVRTVAGALDAVAQAGRPATEGVSHPTAGEVDLVASPIRGLPRREATAPPLLGEHTAEVLAELGRDEREISDLAARGVIGVL